MQSPMTLMRKTGKPMAVACTGETVTGQSDKERFTVGTLHSTRGVVTGLHLVSQIPTISLQLTQLTHIAFGQIQTTALSKRTTPIQEQQVTVRFRRQLQYLMQASWCLAWRVRRLMQFRGGVLSF